MTTHNTVPGHYNLESVYDEKINPLMQQIIAICKEHHMPMVASFAYEHCEEKGRCCCTTTLTFEGRHIKEFAEATSVIRGNPLFSAFTVMSGVKGQ
ncbi:hypothetical protein NJB71_001253 [Salmonella enterica]|uniref:Uncharacterized protein n=1 Tax=Salmonella enterica TaxID=28901 RepID=A0A5Y7LG13_SALER|nr:hypothetical protein [Salmonella enterica]ECX3436804.1 hypothetical protein [Salmonella enterica subsp. enterica serovar Rubislaw]ECX6833386.1 hypothetical protein [Salmonella enterica subsp. enterica serovar Montevideo]EDT7511980.1 hypothetical protein [Salmonella enterica subsp. enterica serovar Javiana]EDU0725102.1 hypothetical protein [Salmonella enterica subsp. enterica serovar 9,12:-:1,5]EDX3293737.1 hypothetical protein [Salmonella enterica subsp. enterica serovar Luciana]EEA6887855